MGDAAAQGVHSDRLDRVLVARGLFSSRAQAQAAIAAGLVRVEGDVARKPSASVPFNAPLEAQPAHPWASRAGLKLDHALTTFGIDPKGLHCLDVGASTGGFVDVLLTRGAAHVDAVDVGRDQLLPRLRDDPRVRDLSSQDARTLSPSLLTAAPELITCDASFIGVLKVLPQPLSLAAPNAVLIALFKPQFEVGPAAIGKGGIVRDAEAVARARAGVLSGLEALGWPVLQETPSPILGGDGNAETLLCARRTPQSEGAA